MGLVSSLSFWEKNSLNENMKARCMEFSKVSACTKCGNYLYLITTVPHGCFIILPNKNLHVKHGIDHPVHRRYSRKILSLPKIIALKILLSGTGGSSLRP